MPNRVEKIMDETVQQDIINHIKSASTLLNDYNVSRRQIGNVSGQHMGTGNGVEFVKKAFTIVVEHPEIMDGLYKKQPYETDINFYKMMKPIIDVVAELQTALSETLVLLGQDLMEHANLVLGKLKSASDHHGGVYTMLYNDLNFLYENRAKLASETKAMNQKVAELAAKTSV